jgi:phytoene dehydrogenase-like protein
MSRDFDFVVIGATVGGLAAAGMLSKAGARVLVVEEKLAPPEPRGALFALDPALVTDLKLVQQGLAFTRNDLTLTGWDEEAPPLTLGRDRRATARAIARLSDADGEAWGPFQAELLGRGRALRRWWNSPHRDGAAAEMLWQPGERARFARECVAGAAGFLARHFESPRLAGILLHDAVGGGLEPSEPGSTLALIWRAAQEMAGQQAASALCEPGSLVAALRKAAEARLELGAAVSEILVARGAAVGVTLDDGERIGARAVLSSLPRFASERLAGLERPDAANPVGEAQLVLSLADGVELPAELRHGRAVAGLTPEDYADAHEAARAGRLPPLPPYAVVAEGPRRLIVTLPLMPVAPPQGWPALEAILAATLVKHLSRNIPGLASGLTGVTVTPPKRRPRPGAGHLLAPALARATTHVPGLYLCGEDAEPLPCVSGRAGRFAAHFATKPTN